jgi:hypothetical protein
MAKFINIPSFNIGDIYLWILAGDLIYRSDYWAELIIAPKGFETDFASIPKWIPRWLFDPAGRHRAAAVVHDYLARLEGFDRKIADLIFFEAMGLLDVKKWRKKLMYWAVRIGSLRKR